MTMAFPGPQRAHGQNSTEEVQFESEGLVLKGTLALPEAATSRLVPAVILVHGSAVTDRDVTFPIMWLKVKAGRMTPDGPPSEEWAIKPFRDIAEGLAAQGYASLRYDKRGYGRDKSSRLHLTLDLLCQDVLSALDYLDQKEGIDKQNIFLLGHSEGGIVAQEVAACSGKVRGLILLGSPVTPIQELTLSQTAYCQRQWKHSQEAIEMNLAQIKSQYEGILSGAYTDEMYQGQPTVHWRSLFRHDNLEAIKRCRSDMPVLIMGGGKDWQVPPSEAFSTYRAFQDGGSADLELHVFPGLDHFLLEEPGVSRVETYFTRRRRIPRQVMATIVEWMNGTTKDCTKKDNPTNESTGQ